MEKRNISMQALLGISSSFIYSNDCCLRIEKKRSKESRKKDQKSADCGQVNPLPNLQVLKYNYLEILSATILVP